MLLHSLQGHKSRKVAFIYSDVFFKMSTLSLKVIASCQECFGEVFHCCFHFVGCMCTQGLPENLFLVVPSLKCKCWVLLLRKVH